uniref:VWFA domain-containing protein n=1 Tax=Setaria digitata TaxID=48799 RepID=A0A915PJS8_9BILA
MVPTASSNTFRFGNFSGMAKVGSCFLKPLGEKQMINMANDVVKQFDVHKKGHRIAILEFSSKAIISKWLRYQFDRIKTNDDMEKVIKNLPHIFGATDTGQALGVILHEFLPQRRPGLPFLVFIITDGYYRDSEEVQKNVASLATKPNVQLFVATASKLHNMQGLLLLANNNLSHVVADGNFLNFSRNILKPYSECFTLRKSFVQKRVTLPAVSTTRTFTALSFITTATIHGANKKKDFHKRGKFSQDLKLKDAPVSEFALRATRFTRKSSLSNRTEPVVVSIVTTSTAKNIPKSLKIKLECLLDVLFLMDFSGGTSDKRAIYIDLVSRLIRSLDISQTSAHVGTVYYSGPKRARTLFHLRKHSTAEEAIKDLGEAPSNGGTTRTGEAIYYAISEFDEKFGARKDARKMLIIFTDGYSQDDPTKAGRMARSKGIELKAIVVEDENVPPDTEQIIAITGDPSVCN